MTQLITRVRAMQRVYYNDRLYEEGAVFDYVGELPPANVVMPIADVPPVPPDSGLKAPVWTTPGHIERSQRLAAQREITDPDILS